MQKHLSLKKGRPTGSRTFDPSIAIAFGSAVREFRMLCAVSQEELALIANVERSHMGKIERGEHLPNLALIIKLAAALKLTPGTLIDRTLELLPDSPGIKS